MWYLSKTLLLIFFIEIFEKKKLIYELKISSKLEKLRFKNNKLITLKRSL